MMSLSNKESVTAVIPAYNEETRIRDTINDVKQFVDEVIVVDDASEDGTFNKARSTGAIVLRNEINKGYIHSVKKGFKKASNEIIVTIDADGELPAEKIPGLVKPILSGKADMVQGKRNYIVRPSERFLTWLAGFKGAVGDSGTGFRAIKKDLAVKLNLNANCICGIFSLEVLKHNGRITQIPIKLQKIDKPRSIAWYHIGQLYYLIKFMLINK